MTMDSRREILSVQRIPSNNNSLHSWSLISEWAEWPHDNLWVPVEAVADYVQTGTCDTANSTERL